MLEFVAPQSPLPPGRMLKASYGACTCKVASKLFKTITRTDRLLRLEQLLKYMPKTSFIEPIRKYRYFLHSAKTKEKNTTATLLNQLGQGFVYVHGALVTDSNIGEIHMTERNEDK